MSLESVDIKVVDTTPSATPIENVVVKILSADGTTIYGQLTTGPTGIVSTLLPNATYQIRCFKFGVSFQASLIDVVVSPPANKFEVQGEKYVYPSSTDPRLCTASGHFRTPTGGIARGIDIHFIARWNPITLDGSAIMPERVTTRSNDSGYAEIPLIRFAQYDVTIEGMEDYQRTISVPDAPAVNISDLIFPVVDVITIEEAGPYTVAQGADLTLTPHVFSSDLNEQSPISQDVNWSTSDTTKLGLDVQATTLVLRGITPGTYTLLATRRDTSIIRIPNTPIQGVPVTVTVTP
jgi:hypothetical protein